MANKTIGMSKIRQIIRMHCQGQGKKHISRTTGVSRNTLKKYLARFAQLRTTWEALSAMSDKDLDALFVEAPVVEPPARVREVFEEFPRIEQQLRQRGMTLQKVWEAHIARHPGGFRKTAFYKYYRIWKQRSHPLMHLEHKAGDKMFVDFAGEKMKLVDKETGEVTPVEVFVAILGASQLTYVEAVAGQGAEDFIGCCENALHYYGGAPAAIVPDNLKAAVVKSSRYEPRINDNFEAFAQHYGMAVLPARSYKPRDKALVEGAVKIVYTRIYTALREKHCCTLAQMNAAIGPPLDGHNRTPFQGRSYSRQDQFEAMEKHTLQPLAALRYEMRRQAVVTVMKNGHVCLGCDKHYYSVPYGYIGKKAKVLYCASRVDVYCRYVLIASHERVRTPYRYSTQAPHLAGGHRYLLELNPETFLKQGREIHPDVESYIAQVLHRKPHPEQAYNSCRGILNFARRVGRQRLINACRRAHGYGLYNFGIIENILRRGLDKEDAPGPADTPSSIPSHGNIRGGQYYK